MPEFAAGREFALARRHIERALEHDVRETLEFVVLVEPFEAKTLEQTRMLPLLGAE